MNLYYNNYRKMVIINNKNNSKKNWKLLEFSMPIKETISDNKDFLIRGVAINETTTRNGITYRASELEKAAPSFRNKPILLDHRVEISSLVGRTTENVNFNSISKAIEFEGRIVDEEIKKKINSGLITDVSIGCQVEDLVENKKDGSITAIGMEGLEISLVCVPGDPGANLANALSESYKLKEIDMNGQEVELGKPEEEASDTELNNEEEDNMGEAEKETVETPEVETIETPAEETPAEEKLDVKAITAGITENAKSIAALTELMTKKVKEDAEETPAPSAPAEEDEIPAAVEDETTGDVGGEAEEKPAVAEEGVIIEKADVGRGFQIYRDYSKDSGKFNRLCR